MLKNSDWRIWCLYSILSDCSIKIYTGPKKRNGCGDDGDDNNNYYNNCMEMVWLYPYAKSARQLEGINYNLLEIVHHWHDIVSCKLFSLTFILAIPMCHVINQYCINKIKNTESRSIVSVWPYTCISYLVRQCEASFPGRGYAVGTYSIALWFIAAARGKVLFLGWWFSFEWSYELSLG